MDTLQELSCMTYLLHHYHSVQLTIEKTDPADITRPKDKLTSSLPRICEVLRASDPLWLFKICESVIERITDELRFWVNNNFCFPEVISFPLKICLNLGQVVWKNLRLDPVQTALNLTNNENLLLDYRLVMAVHFGWLEVGKTICENNTESKFSRQNEITPYRRVALGFLPATDLLLTSANHIRHFPSAFLIKNVPPKIFLDAVNFMESLRFLLTELIWDMGDDGRMEAYFNEFVRESGRNLDQHVGPIMVSTLISTFCCSRYRCEKLLQVSRLLISGETGTENLIAQWTGSLSTSQKKFDKMSAVLLAVCKHPLIIDRLLQSLQDARDFPISHDAMLNLAQRNDLTLACLIQRMSTVVGPTESDPHFNVEKLWQILEHNEFELFHSICYCNAWRTVAELKRLFLPHWPDKFEALVHSRQYANLLAACKKGNFLVVHFLTEDMREDEWREFFAQKHFEAFYCVCKSGFTAIIEWFGLICAKYDLKGLYEEAHFFTLRLLEVEAKSLQSALNAVRQENEPENEPQPEPPNDQ